MTAATTRTKYSRIAKPLPRVTMETAKESSKGSKEVSEAFGRAIREMNETNLQIRREERAHGAQNF